MLTEAIHKFGIPREPGGQPDKKVNANEFMFMQTAKGYHQFKHSKSRNYVFLKATGVKSPRDLVVPATDKPFMKGIFPKASVEGGAATRQAGAYYIVDKGTGKAVEGPFTPATKADDRLEKKYSHKTHQVIDKRYLNPQSYQHLKGETQGSTESDELKMFIDNDADLYRQQFIPMIKNLMTKRAQGKYNGALAVKLFMYLVDNGAKKYAKEHGSPGQKWNDMFPKKDRLECAKEFVEEFEGEADLGNYDEYIPKKYQKKGAGTVQAVDAKSALLALYKWATTGDRNGNPYSKPEVRNAIKALGDASGFDLPEKRPSGKIPGALYDLAKWATTGDRTGNPHAKPEVKNANRALGGDGFDLPKNLQGKTEGDAEVQAEVSPAVGYDIAHSIIRVDLPSTLTSMGYDEPKKIISDKAKFLKDWEKSKAKGFSGPKIYQPTGNIKSRQLYVSLSMNMDVSQFSVQFQQLKPKKPIKEFNVPIPPDGKPGQPSSAIMRMAKQYFDRIRREGEVEAALPSSEEQLKMMSANPPRVKRYGNLYAVEVFSPFVKKYIPMAEWPDAAAAKKDLASWMEAHKETLTKLKQVVGGVVRAEDLYLSSGDPKAKKKGSDVEGQGKIKPPESWESWVFDKQPVSEKALTDILLAIVSQFKVKRSDYYSFQHKGHPAFAIKGIDPKKVETFMADFLKKYDEHDY